METRGVVCGPHGAEKRRLARAMRRETTHAEALLWERFRKNRLAGLHFRRQQVIDGFIADFYCHSAGLIVEADGAVHVDRAEYDAIRDRVVSARGLAVLRFTNDQIETSIEAVLAEILAVAQSRLSPTS
jgi:very-short-patch-repair endonuclease